MGERSTGIKLTVVFCYMRTYDDGCNIDEQMLEDLVFIHSITQTSPAPITEYLNKHD